MKRIISIVLILSIFMGALASTDLTVIADTPVASQVLGELYFEEVLSSFENKADNFDYTSYQARHYTSGEAKSTVEFRIGEDTNCYNLVEYLKYDSWFQSAYQAWEFQSLILDPVETIQKDIYRETYYETVILDIINATVTSDNAIDWINQSAIKNSVKILNSMTEYVEADYYWYIASKNISISDLTNEEYAKMMEFSENYVNSQNYEILNDLSFLEDVLSLSKDIEEYSQRLASYCQLIALGDEIADFLEIVKNNTDDPYLIKAINNIIPIIRDSYNSLLATTAKDGVACIGTFALKKIVGEAWEEALVNLLNGGVLFDGKAIANASLLALSIGQTLTNIAFSVNEKMDKYELMRALCSFEDAMEKAAFEILNNYQNTEAYHNLVLSGVSIVYQTYITDAEIYSQMVQICQSDWGSNLVEEELNRVLEISKNNKQLYQSEYDSLRIKSGVCGDMVGWALISEKELIVYGVGAMMDFQDSSTPWNSCCDTLEQVYVSSYISQIGSFSFQNLTRLSEPIILSENVICNSNAFDIYNDIICKNDLTLLGEHNLRGTLYVDKSLNCSANNLHIYGEVYINGNLESDSTANIYNYGNIKVNGDANFIAKSHGLDDTFGYVYIYSGAVFHICNNLNLKGAYYGNVATNWFLLYVDGQLIVDGNFKASERFVALNQTSSDSLIKVKGDFYLNVLNANYVAGFDVGCKGYECVFTAGNLYVGGHYSNESTVTFSGSHTIILNGTEEQTIKNLNACNLDIANPSATGVCFSGISYVTGALNSNTSKLTNGSNLHINGGNIIGNTLNGDISIRGSFEFTNDLTIYGNVYAVETVETNITVPKGITITIEGNAFFNAKTATITVFIAEGGELVVLGNVSLQGNDSNPAFYNSIISIDGSLVVGGNVACSSCYSFNQCGGRSFTSISGNLTFEENGWFYSYKNITAGTIEVKGRVHNYEATSNNILVLNGAKTQQVSADYVYTHKFGTVASTVVIENTTGVSVTSQLTVTTLFNHNGNSFTLYNHGSNSTFVDYDGDGLKDNVDSHPTIHESCIVGHNYSEWQMETEPTPNNDGLQYKVCSRCGDRIEEIIPAIARLSFSGASLTLEDDLVINYKVDESLFNEVGYTNPYVIFYLNDVEKKVIDFSQKDGKYIFDFEDIIPHQMNDTIYATLYATYNGIEYSSEMREYSVATYCYNMLNKYTADEYAKLRTLLVDLLNYGAASQTYMSYKTDNLVNENLTEEQKAWGTNTERLLVSSQELQYKTIDSPSVQWKGAGLNLQKSVGMRFKIATDSIENLVVKVTNDNGEEKRILYNMFEKAEGGYYVYFDGVNAGQMSDVVYLTVYDGEIAVSDTIRYSIESYACAKQNDADQELAELVKTMMKYGDSARIYANQGEN